MSDRNEGDGKMSDGNAGDNGMSDKGMNMFRYSEFFAKSVELKSLVRGAEEQSAPVFVYGADVPELSMMACAIAEKYERDVLLYFEDDMKARAAHRIHPGSVHIAPSDIVFGQSFSKSREEEAHRREILHLLAEKKRNYKAVFCSALCAMEKYPSVSEEHESFELRTGEAISLSAFFNFLYDEGYEKVGYITQKGEISVRGGIIDLYSPMHELPLRIELFGDEIDSIRYFDLATQSSLRKIDRCTVYGAGGGAGGRRSGDGGAPLEAYLKNPLVFLVGASGTVSRMRRNEADFLMRITAYFLENEDFSPASMIGREGVSAEGEGAEGIAAFYRYRADEALERLSAGNLVITEPLQKTPEDFRVGQMIPISAKEMYGDTGVVISEMRRLQLAGYYVCISFFTEDRRRRFVQMLADRSYDAPFVIETEGGSTEVVASSLPDSAEIPPLHLIIGNFEKSVIFSTFKSALITEHQIFSSKKKQSGRRIGVSGIKAFSELNAGDHVVHDAFGIGVFSGIEQIVTEGVRRDYLKICYAGSDILYLPVESAGLIRKYVGADREKVKISKMGSLTWKTQVSKARKGIEDIADDLIELYARRRNAIGFAFGPDTPWQKEFEDLFPYEETPDQLKATEEIKRDMESETPMDRLLSGDVGYGKTEVALRAAFKAVSASKQVAVLVPTTVLAQQHYNNVRARFSGYPVKVEMVSRFRSAPEIKKILAKLKTGEIDILIGTHRLLSKDVVFKDLGLLVVDEEQRFGVKHKEAIKKMRENIDVLTLTATPIPRTLHMSILGVRDMSVLEDPPAERSPVQTYVMEYSSAIVREAIVREVERGGQVYYVYNRIDGIERIAAELQEMLPDVSIRTAHGRMGEEALERIMLDFMDGKFDVLVSTTIIETGLDISNVNTMIVRGADMLGLSQLYQLRGRVGRSSRKGYCYAFFQRGKQLTEIQERRLRAVREFTDLGAGFKIAMKDLEIRGAGNLLGTAQSGFMEVIGYDMFVRLLDETLRRRKGEQLSEQIEAKIELKVNAYIPDDYISDSQERIAVYKQISAVSAEAGTAGILSELEDRYGKAPIPLRNLLRVSEIKSMCEGIGIALVREQGGHIYLRFSPDAKLDLFRMGAMLNKNTDVSYCSGKVEELRLERPEDEERIAEIAKTVKRIYNDLM